MAWNTHLDEDYFLSDPLAFKATAATVRTVASHGGETVRSVASRGSVRGGDRAHRSLLRRRPRRV